MPSNPDLDYYYILRETPNNESIIVEYGFADSTGDDVNQLKNNWQDLAEAVVKSLAQYTGVPYSPVSSADTYIVKSGDTLWSIARNNGLTVNELKALNNLTSNALSIGQVLKVRKISDTPTTSVDTYTVKSGDTLYGIARMFGLTIDELKSLNNLTSNTLSIGQVLKVSESTVPSSDNYYVVKAGDSLYKIAGMYGTTVDELKRLNNLSSNALSVGQRLRVPSTSTYQTYTVKAGDSLYGIAREFNTTVTEIQRLNNLSTSTLSIGQKLLIP